MITVIGLTGPSGAGKTTFCEIASGMGIQSIDADQIYHSLLVPPSLCLDELRSEFGESVIAPNGTLDRPALAAIVFDEKDEKKEKISLLNRITHKYVLAKMRELIRAEETNGTEAIIVDAPALYESGFDKECDFVICLLAESQRRLDRITHRDNITRERADARIQGQKSDEFYSGKADYTVINNESIESMKEEISRIFSERGLLRL